MYGATQLQVKVPSPFEVKVFGEGHELTGRHLPVAPSA
jgi:hypothetical protein